MDVKGLGFVLGVDRRFLSEGCGGCSSLLFNRKGDL